THRKEPHARQELVTHRPTTPHPQKGTPCAARTGDPRRPARAGQRWFSAPEPATARPGRSARYHATAPPSDNTAPTPPATATARAGFHTSASTPPTSTATPCAAMIPDAATPMARPRPASGVARTKLACV